MIASHTEIFLLKKVAPELLSRSGKVSVIFIYIIMTAIATFGIVNCEIEFDFDFFMTDEEQPFYKFSKAKVKYFDADGSLLNIFVNNTDANFFTKESQLKMLEFEDSLQRCRDCSK